MKAYDLVQLASRNLRESLLRNGLTTAGISVGVASLVAMISLGVGLQQLAGKRLSSSGLFDTIAVTSIRRYRQRHFEERKPAPKAAAQAAEPRLLDESARQSIARLPDVIEVEPEVRFMAEVRFGNRFHVASVGGLAPSARDNDALQNIQGRFFSSPAAHEVIVRKHFAQQLDATTPASVIGQELVLRYAERKPLPDSDAAKQAGNNGDDEDSGFSVVRRQQKLRIVGIIDEEPFGGMRASSRAAIFIPTQLAEDLHIMQASDLRGAARTAKLTYSELMTRVSSPRKVEAVEGSIRKMGFHTFSILDASQGLRRFFTVLDLFLGIFGSLALAVASMGIVNTLVMAVLERRREIGILKAVGASDGDVEKLFVAEAAAMGLIGGIVGVVLGRVIGWAINFGTGVYLQRHGLPADTVWSAPAWLMGAAILFAILVSLISGLYPARRAARMDPVQALRYE